MPEVLVGDVYEVTVVAGREYMILVSTAEDQSFTLADDWRDEVFTNQFIAADALRYSAYPWANTLAPVSPAFKNLKIT